MCLFSHPSNGAFINSDRSSIPFDVSLTLKTRPSALGMSDPVVVAWTSCRCPSCPCPPCHMGMSYLISLTPMLLRNIALDGSFKHFSYVYLCMSVFVCVFVIVFVISVRQWIVGVMSFQKIYDLIGLT